METFYLDRRVFDSPLSLPSPSTRGYRGEYTRLNEYATLFDNGRVGISTSVLLTGHTPGGKKWSRWVTPYSTSSHITKSGRVYFTSRQRGKWIGGQFAARMFHSHAKDFTEAGVLSDQALERLSQLDMYTHSPLMQHYRISLVNNSPYVNFLRNDSVPELTMELFGAKNYRKDLVRAVANGKINTIFAASHFKNLVPIDWLISMINNDQSTGIDVPMPNARARWLFQQLPERTRRNIATSAWNDVSWNDISDSVRMASGYHLDLSSVRARDSRDLHEQLVQMALGPNRNRYAPEIFAHQAFGPKTFAPEVFSSRWLKIHDAFEETEYTSVLPTGVEMMHDWGQKMSNCVGGYGREVQQGRAFVGALYREERIICNYEIVTAGRTLECRQLLGRFNRSLDKATHDDVVSIMQGAGVVFPAHYLGRVA